MKRYIKSALSLMLTLVMIFTLFLPSGAVSESDYITNETTDVLSSADIPDPLRSRHLSVP